jgi:hypothetical protein
MATTVSPKTIRYYKNNIKKKTYTQTVSIAVGCLMIVIGLSGILNPEFMGMHLSAMHTLVLIGTGSLAIWAAHKANKKRAYQVSMGLGIFYAIHALAGFLLGEPGTPRVGYDAPDDFLLRIAPGFLELGTVDHGVHAFLAIFFISGAVSWRRHHNDEITSGG